MEIIIEHNHDNNLFEEVAFYKGMLGEFSYNPREFCITFANIKDKQTDVLRYIGSGNVINLPIGVMAVPYLLKEGYDDFDNVTIVNHSNSLIDIDYMLYKTHIKVVELKGFQTPVYIQTAESAFEGSDLETIDVSTISLSRCNNMIRMFANTKLTKVDVSNIYLRNDANIEHMFVNCGQLEEVKLFNNGADTKLDIAMNQPFYNCNCLKDLRIYDADEFRVIDYNGDIQSIIPETCPLYTNVNAFLLGFVSEFDEKLGVQLNEAFDIRVINEYSMMLRKSMPKDMLNNVKFIFRLLQELKVDEHGEQGNVGQIHFVSNIEEEKTKRQQQGNNGKVVLVQPRQTTDADVMIYALYLGNAVKGYRVKYDGKYYDITPAESVELGFTSIVPSKKLKLTCDNEKYHVCQKCGEKIDIYGYEELVQALAK